MKCEERRRSSACKITAFNMSTYTGGFTAGQKIKKYVKCSDIVDSFIQCHLKFNLMQVIHEQVGVRGHLATSRLQE